MMRAEGVGVGGVSSGVLILGMMMVAMAFLSGCSDLFGPGGEEEAVRVSASGFVLQPGDTARLHAQVGRLVRGDHLTGPQSVTPAWSSDNEAVVTIRADGRLSAVAPGRATIWAQVGDLRDSASVRVRSAGDHPRVRWRSVSVGLTHACAVTVQGLPYCWGLNFFAELGTGSRRAGMVYLSPSPVHDVPDLSSIHVVGIHGTCGLTGSGEAWCWGYRSAMGTGEDGDHVQRRPTRIRFSGRVSRIGGGLGHACLVDEGGRAFCWGANFSGQLGSGTWDLGLYVPSPVETDRRFVSIEGAGSATCALTVEGKLYCWGSHQGGEVGVGPTGIPMYNTPQPVSPELTFTDAAARCAVEVGGATRCWSTSLGIEGYDWHAGERIAWEPGRVVDDPGFAQVWSSDSAHCGLTEAGQAYCWGFTTRGLSGSLESTGEICSAVDQTPCSSRPLPVAGDHRFRTLSVGRYTACGITTDDELYCWGSNDTTPPGHPDRDRGILLGGLLGDGTTRSHSPVPVRVEDPG